MPGNSRHLAYVASNMDDLELERFELKRMLARLGMIDIGIPCPGVGAEYDWELARQQIEQADLFILLTGELYGETSQTGLSHIHREFVHARTLGKPVIAFLKRLPQGHLKDEALRLKNFYTLVTQQVSYKEWHLRDELLSKARLALGSILPELGPGWAPVVVNEPDETEAEPEMASTEKPELSSRERMELSRRPVNLLVSAKVYEGGNLTREEVVLPARMDQLFRALQSSFTASTSEDRVRGNLENVIGATVRKQLLSRRPGAHAVDDIRITKQQFRSILESWRTLGMVEMEERGGRHFWHVAG